MEQNQPEKRFILNCLRAFVVLEDSPLVHESERFRQYNWEWILETCITHRVAGFVTFVLQQSDLLRYLDYKVQERLVSAQLQAKKKHDLRQAQFRTVVDILKSRDVPLLPLKGVALSKLVYEHSPYREMFDIDILIRRVDLREAFYSLVEAGFRRRDVSLSKNRWHKNIFAETSPPYGDVPLGRIPLVREDLQLDLHFNPRYRVAGEYLEIDVDGMWERSGPHPQFGSNVHMAAPKDIMFYLLFHTVEFYSPRLIQVLDTALLIDRYGSETDWYSNLCNLNISIVSRENLILFVSVVQEWISRGSECSVFSAEAGSIFERFFSRIRNPNIMPQDKVEARHQISGFQVLKAIRHPGRKALFVTGYLFPDPDYYSGKGRVKSFLAHWFALISKLLRLCLYMGSGGRSGHVKMWLFALLLDFCGSPQR